MSYPVPACFTENETEIKKSRFIAWAEKVEDREQAKAFLERARQAYPDARHHCWAYQIGNPASPTNAAMSDDGEPSGTAGKPILNVLQHKNVGDVMVIIIRYFGGVKLGAGGLVRAYSGAAEAVMSQLSIQQRIALSNRKLEIDFSQEQLLRHWLSKHQGEVVSINYQQNVTLEVSFATEYEAAFDEFKAAL